MDFEDEPAPWQLEQLLFSSSESDYVHGYGEDEDSHLRAIERRLADDPEYFPAQLRRLLDMVHEDDPLLQTTQSKPYVPLLKGAPFTVQDIRGKGMGVLATRRIPAGRILLTDPYLLSVEDLLPLPPTPPPAGPEAARAEALSLQLVLLQLLSQYLDLPAERRTQLAGLHAHATPARRAWFRACLNLSSRSSSLRGGPEAEAGAETLEAEAVAFLDRLYFTFSTNEFWLHGGAAAAAGGGSTRTRRLFLVTSRINHSCHPNARSRQTTDGRKVVTALRDIEEGEEVTLRYLDHHRYGTRGAWREATERMWGLRVIVGAVRTNATEYVRCLWCVRAG